MITCIICIIRLNIKISTIKFPVKLSTTINTI